MLSFDPLKANLLLHHQKQLKNKQMKKIGFALQVFALITVLPLYVVVEMNHTTLPSAENSTISKNKGKAKTRANNYLQTGGHSINSHYSEAFNKSLQKTIV
jgi:hypothetical protein